MATKLNTGGQRRAIDVLAEVSLALVDRVLYTQLATAPSPGGYGSGGYGGGGYGAPNGTNFTLPAATYIGFYLYVGAPVVLDYLGANEEVVTVLSINLTQNSFNCQPTLSHAAGETVFAAAFPTQQPTDPLFTVEEILGYLARVQNDFLNKVPLVIEFSDPQLLLIGQQYQQTPADAIEMERVAIINGRQQESVVTSVARVAGVVTAVLLAPEPQPGFTLGLAVQVAGVADDSFNTVGAATVTVATVSADGLTLTWQQAGVAADASSTGGVIGPPSYTRLYESSQEQIAMRDPEWWTNTGAQQPTNWYEDRAGVYGWGVAPIPRTNNYAQVLASRRDAEELALLDGFLLPDCFVYGVKYGVLAQCLSKSGQQTSPSMARYYQSRFDFAVMLADRFLRNITEGTTQNGS